MSETPPTSRDFPPGAPVASKQRTFDLPNLWDLYIRDNAGRPIDDLNLWLHIDGKVLAFTTSNDGQVSGIPRSENPIKVEIERATGGRKEVAQVELSPTTAGLVLTSPKTKHQGNTRINSQEANNLSGSDPRTGSTTGKLSNDEWLRNAMQAHTPASNEHFTYRCHSLNAQHKARWKPLERLLTYFRKSPSPIKQGLGRMSVPVMGQGTTAATRKPNGLPATIVGVEGWEGRLVLGRGREHLRPAFDHAMELASVQATGIKAYALAAVINAESRTIQVNKEEPVLNPDGTPKINKKTKKPITRMVPDYDYWDENSFNPASGHAAGLCQFIESTWIGQARMSCTELHKEAVRRRLLVDKVILASEGEPAVYDAKLPERVQRLKKAQEDYQNAKEHCENEKKSAPSSSKPKWTQKPLTPPTPPKSKKRFFVETRKDLQALLDIRFEGYWNLIAGAELMAQNLRGFQAKGFQVDTLTNPFEVARVGYLLHFLGVGGAASLINKTMSENTAKINLLNQVGQSEVEASRYMSDKNSDNKWSQGLWEFTQRICNKKLDAGFNKFTYPNSNSQKLSRGISEIIDSIKEIKQ